MFMLMFCIIDKEETSPSNMLFINHSKYKNIENLSKVKLFLVEEEQKQRLGSEIGISGIEVYFID